jgi:hypothetical protein
MMSASPKGSWPLNADDYGKQCDSDDAATEA